MRSYIKILTPSPHLFYSYYFFNFILKTNWILKFTYNFLNWLQRHRRRSRLNL